MSTLRKKAVCLFAFDIPPGVAVNTGIHLATQYGATVPSVAGMPVKDRSQCQHTGLPIWPNVVLAVSPADLRTIIQRARDDSDVIVLDYPEQGFTTSTDDEYRTEIEAASENELKYYGCLLFGDRKRVDKVMKGFALSLWSGVQLAVESSASEEIEVGDAIG